MGEDSLAALDWTVELTCDIWKAVEGHWCFYCPSHGIYLEFADKHPAEEFKGAHQCYH